MKDEKSSMDDASQSKKENNEKPVNHLLTDACRQYETVQPIDAEITYLERYLRALNACTVIEKNP